MKRILEITAAVTGLLICAPVICLIAILIYLRMGTPIFFYQTRIGYCGQPFRMVKFRTMRNACDFDGTHLTDKERITPLGAILRSTSLDELPELWNVVRGEMSFVGPRPLLPEYIPLYSKRQARRHEVRPGITGWAQVNGRNAVDWPQKLEMDVWYVDNRSIWLDFRILFITIAMVMKRKGISAHGEATVKKFRGET